MNRKKRERETLCLARVARIDSGEREQEKTEECLTRLMIQRRRWVLGTEERKRERGGKGKGLEGKRKERYLSR